MALMCVIMESFYALKTPAMKLWNRGLLRIKCPAGGGGRDGIFRQEHSSDVIMGPLATPITSLTLVYSTVYSRRRSKKSSKLRVTGLCAGNAPGTGEFLAQMASNAENVSIWLRHHEVGIQKCDVTTHTCVTCTSVITTLNLVCQSRSYSCDWFELFMVRQWKGTKSI